MSGVIIVTSTIKEFKVKKSIYVLKPGDLIPGIIVLLMFFAPLYSGINRNSTSSKVTVEENNIKILDIDLSKDAVYDRGHMKIEVKARKIRVLDSDCAGRICVNMGYISLPGSAIVCAPNKTVLKIEDNKTAPYDAVSY